MKNRILFQLVMKFKESLLHRGRTRRLIQPGEHVGSKPSRIGIVLLSKVIKSGVCHRKF